MELVSKIRQKRSIIILYTENHTASDITFRIHHWTHRGVQGCTRQ